MKRPNQNPPQRLIDGLWHTSRDVMHSIAPWVGTFLKHAHINPNKNKDTCDKYAFLIPGFMAGDYSLWPTRCALKYNGFHTKGSGLRWANAFISQKSFNKCETHFLKWSDHINAPATIIGQSAGGFTAMELAKRHPARVAHVITLGTPHNFKDRPIYEQPFLRRIFHAVNGQALNNRLKGRCADLRFLSQTTYDETTLRAAFNTYFKDMRITSFYAQKDTIVLPTQTHIPQSDMHKNIQMPDTYHMQMAVKPAALRQILHALTLS